MFRTSSHAISAAILLILAAGPAAVSAESREDARKLDRSDTISAPDSPGGVRPKGMVGKVGPTRANDPHDLPCTADEIFVVYEEDKNGNPVPGTEKYGCTDP